MQRSGTGPAGRLDGLRLRARDLAQSQQPGLAGIIDAALLLAVALRRTLRASLVRVGGWISRLAVALGTLLVIRGYLIANHALPVRPRSISPTDGWWQWYDQQKTLQAIMALHRHNLDSSEQWYQPLYPMLGALAMHLTPQSPLFWPDLIGLVATFLLFVPLARLMGVGRVMAVVLFVFVVTREQLVLNNWVIPWNTTLTTPLILLGLLSAAKMVQATSARTDGRPEVGESRIWPFWFGGAAGLIPAFRPTDLLTLLPGGLVVLFCVLLAPARRPIVLARTAAAAAAVAGFAVGFGITLASYLPIFGPHESSYMVMSSQTGFDWHLLPLHWVTLVVGPRPLFPGQAGLIEGFWWLPACLAGAAAVLIACLLRRRLAEGWRVHAIVLGAIVPYWALYLSYRDLHPPGLWKYNNFHYFIWTFPLLAVYGLRWAGLVGAAMRTLIRTHRHSGTGSGLRNLVPVGAGTLLTVLALCWRPQLGPWPNDRPAPTIDAARDAAAIPGGLSDMRDVLLLSAEDPASRIDFGEHRLQEGGQTFNTFRAFRAFPQTGGMMVMPLRVLPHADGTLRFDGVRLDPSVPPRMLRQDTVFGLPCWVPRIVRAQSCTVASALPGQMFPAGRQIDFNSKMENAFLIPGGWTDHSDGRWTLGYTSSLKFRVPGRPSIGGGVVLEVEGAGFVPRGADYLAIDVAANSHVLTRWVVSTTREVALRVSVPEALIPADGQLLLTLSALNARRPADTLAHSTDRRLLGFRVRAVRLLPWAQHEDQSATAP